MILETLPLVQKLSKEDQLMLADEIYDKLEAEFESDEADEIIKAELDRRTAEYEADPEGTTISWEESKARIIKAHRDKPSA